MPTTSLGIRYPGPHDVVDATSWQNLASDVDGLLSAIEVKRAAVAKPPSARVLGSGSQTVAVTTPTTVVYTTEEWDIGGLVNLGVNNDRITLTPGIWIITGTIFYTSQATIAHIEVDLNLNGAQFVQNRIGPFYASAVPQMQATGIVICTVAGDFVSMTAGWSGTGGPAVLFQSYLEAVKIRNYP